MKKVISHPLMENNIQTSDLNSVISHLRSKDPMLTQSKNVVAFENAWSKWLGVKHSVFLNSGSSANLVSMSILKILYPKGGEIIVPSLTWVSDISSVLQNGFKPVFVDIDLKTLGMDCNEIQKKVTKKTIAVFVTHAQGFNAINDKLLSFLRKKNIHLIEDVCESHGAKHKNKLLGSFGLMSNFSFYYAHHMSTIEGGMLSTNSYDIYQKARIIRSHGMLRESNDIDFKTKITKKYPKLNPDFIFLYPSYNLRNTEIGGILGLSQLKRLNKIVDDRSKNLELFLSLLNPKKFLTKFKITGSSNYAFNIVIKEPVIKNAISLMKALSANKIEFRRGSAGGGNQLRQPYLENYFPKNYFLKFPKTEHIHFFGFYIGNYPGIKKNKIRDICEIINSSF